MVCKVLLYMLKNRSKMCIRDSYRNSCFYGGGIKSCSILIRINLLLKDVFEKILDLNDTFSIAV